ncbi:hypothetical protein F5B20DRAFT_583689 [Whalleya microplaca]|nr:hypothetical protein F5B20DRAFT_583689 [Whalleya microplaca]
MSGGDSAADLADLLEQPSLEPPPGVIPDFVNNGGSHTIGYFVVIFCGVLSTLALLSRLGSRISLRRIKTEDVFLFIAYGLFVGYIYVIYEWSIYPGIRVHLWNLPLKNLESFLYGVHLASIFYGLAIMFLKAAILMDWLQIFVPSGQRNLLFWVLHILVWSNILFFASGTLIELFRCHPREKIWNPFFEGGSCPVDIKANNMASGLINLVSDLAILLAPQWVIWHLNASRSRKIGVSLLFVIGIFATACGITRLVVLFQLMASPDQLYYIPDIGLWGIGEMTAGFLIIGIPSAPKTIKSIPGSDSVTSLLNSCRRRGAPTTNHDSKLPRRNPLTRKPRGLWEISDTDTFQLMSVKSANSANATQHVLPSSSDRDVSV